MNQRKSGYSNEVANKYIDKTQAIHSISTELEPQFRFEDKKRTDEIISYKAWFIQKGLPPFIVKFEHEIELPEYLSLINFEELQGCEIGYDVYFKADKIKVVK